MIPMVRILVVAPGRRPEVKSIRNDHYRYHQQVVGGPLEQIRLTSEGDHGADGLVLMCNEEGAQEPVNRYVGKNIIRGTFYFSRMKDGDNVDLTDDDIKVCEQLVRTRREVAQA